MGNFEYSQIMSKLGKLQDSVEELNSEDGWLNEWGRGIDRRINNLEHAAGTSINTLGKRPIEVYPDIDMFDYKCRMRDEQSKLFDLHKRQFHNICRELLCNLDTSLPDSEYRNGRKDSLILVMAEFDKTREHQIGEELKTEEEL